MNPLPRPAGTYPCWGKPEPFDVLTDNRPVVERRQAAAEIGIICSTCPIRSTCHRDAYANGEPWARALAGLSPNPRGAARDIRAWAVEHGYPVGNNGPIPVEVRDAYRREMAA